MRTVGMLCAIILCVALFVPGSAFGGETYNYVYYLPYVEDTSGYRTNVGLVKLLADGAGMDAVLQLYNPQGVLVAERALGIAYDANHGMLI